MEPHQHQTLGCVSQELHPGELGSWGTKGCVVPREGAATEVSPATLCRARYPESDSRKMENFGAIVGTWSLE